jgi:uncharacterized protein (TIGR02594 family)
MTKGLSFIIIAAIMSLTAATSQARTLHHNHHHMHRVHFRAAMHRHFRHFAFHHFRHRRHVAKRVMRAEVANGYRAYASFSTPTDMAPRARSGSDPVAIAERYIGSNPTNHSSLWCADFANFVLRKADRIGTGSRLAKSFLAMPSTKPRYGAIAVMGRRGGGHVGFVAGFDPHGNPIIISGNSRGHRVAMSVYNRHRIIKYVSAI